MNIKKKQKYNIIIQARFNSTRFKGKILKKIKDHEILLIMIKRLSKFKKNIIINISEKNPDKIIRFCKKIKLIFLLDPIRIYLKDIMTAQPTINQK